MGIPPAPTQRVIVRLKWGHGPWVWTLNTAINNNVGYYYFRADYNTIPGLRAQKSSVQWWEQCKQQSGDKTETSRVGAQTASVWGQGVGCLGGMLTCRPTPWPPALPQRQGWLRLLCPLSQVNCEILSRPLRHEGLSPSSTFSGPVVVPLALS